MNLVLPVHRILYTTCIVNQIAVALNIFFARLHVQTHAHIVYSIFIIIYYYKHLYYFNLFFFITYEESRGKKTTQAIISMAHNILQQH